MSNETKQIPFGSVEGYTDSDVATLLLASAVEQGYDVRVVETYSDGFVVPADLEPRYDTLEAAEDADPAVSGARTNRLPADPEVDDQADGDEPDGDEPDEPGDEDPEGDADGVPDGSPELSPASDVPDQPISEEKGEQGFDFAGSSISEIEEYVGDSTERAAEALAAENERTPVRKTLVATLYRIINAETISAEQKGDAR